MRIVCDSSIDFGKVFTVEFTSAGTLTTLILPWIDNCPPLGSSRMWINGIRGEILKFSFKGVKFKHCGFTGNPILLGSLPLLRFEWQVEQIHFVLSILVVVVIHALSNVSENLGYLFASHFLTGDRYHN